MKKYGKFQKIAWLAALAALLLSGCMKRSPAQENIRWITDILVCCDGDAGRKELRCESNETMQPILDYLRLLSPSGTPSEDPEQAVGEEFRIVLHYSDNTQKQYTQRCNRFLKVDGRPWQKINPKRASALAKIVAELEYSLSSQIPESLPALCTELRKVPIC